MIGGASTVTGIIGDPVAQSRSPAIHNAAFAACDLDWVYVAFRVEAGHAAAAFRGVRALSMAGVNVTMPHKAAAAAACDEITEVAATLGAVNTVVVRDGRLLGDSTDGAGFIGALRDEDVDPTGTQILVIGTGGAARAITHALGVHGAHVTVTGRRDDEARVAAAVAPGATVAAFDSLTDTVAASDIVVNATPIGMGGEPPPFDPSALRDGQFVIDTVYYPLETPLLVAARARGARAANGIGMLVHQAALAFTKFTGFDAPIDVMRAAAQKSAQ